MIKISNTEIKDIKIGSTNIQKVYRGLNLIWQRWVLQIGTYASNTFTTNRSGFTPGPVYTSPVFTAVRPKKINMNIRMSQLDFDGYIDYKLEVYYQTSGWVVVATGGASRTAGTTWVFTLDVNPMVEEKATQYRFTSNCRSNGDSQTIKFTEWYV